MDTKISYWEYEQYIRSLEQIDKAARNLLTLSSTFLGAFLGFMSLNQDGLPIYMTHHIIRYISAISVVCLIATVGTSVIVLLPRKIIFEGEETIENKLKNRQNTKNLWLNFCSIFFGFSMLMLGLVVIISLLYLI